MSPARYLHQLDSAHAPSFETLNAALEERCRARQKECAGRHELTIRERLTE
jgi:hypothetical protein